MSDKIKMTAIPIEVTFEEAQAAAEEFWAEQVKDMPAAVSEGPVGGMVMRMLKPIATHFFTSGAGWMLFMLSRRVRAAQELAVVETVGKPN